MNEEEARQWVTVRVPKLQGSLAESDNIGSRGS
jgi:hypothetical protein